MALWSKLTQWEWHTHSSNVVPEPLFPLLLGYWVGILSWLCEILDGDMAFWVFGFCLLIFVYCIPGDFVVVVPMHIFTYWRPCFSGISRPGWSTKVLSQSCLRPDDNRFAPEPLYIKDLWLPSGQSLGYCCHLYIGHTKAVLSVQPYPPPTTHTHAGFLLELHRFS